VDNDQAVQHSEPTAPHRREAALSAVNALAIELASLPVEESVQHCLSERLRQLTGALVAAFSDYDPATSLLTTSYIAAAPELLMKVDTAIGRRLTGRGYPVSAGDVEQMCETVISYHESLTEITFGRVPKLLGIAVQKVFGVERFLALTYTVRGELYGVSMLALGPGTPDPAPEMLEAIVSVGAVSLCRRRAEDALRALNTELEQRIRVRTADLARANRELYVANSTLEALNVDLEQMVVLLDAATRAKSDFLARMSHELRTPLNSIIGFSGTVLSGMAGDITEEQRKQLEMVNRSGRHLLSLINEILDLSAIEAGRPEVASDEVDAVEVASRAFRMLAPLGDEKGLSMRLEASPDVPVMRSDPRRVEQILLNLLGNAVKFTDAGEVILRVTGDPSGVLFEVTDSGCGIAAEHYEEIFDEFYRVPRPDGLMREGSGLGLCVNKRLVETLGGEIALTSEPGNGATFSVRLPAIQTRV
jgi:signal transduction histidine kinase